MASLFVGAKCFDNIVTVNDCFQYVLFAIRSLSNKGIPHEHLQLLGYDSYDDRKPNKNEVLEIVNLEPLLLDSINFKIPVDLPYIYLDKYVIPYIDQKNHAIRNQILEKSLQFIKSSLSLEISAELAAEEATRAVMKNERDQKIQDWMDAVVDRADPGHIQQLREFFESK